MFLAPVPMFHRPRNNATRTVLARLCIIVAYSMFFSPCMAIATSQSQAQQLTKSHGQKPRCIRNKTCMRIANPEGAQTQPPK